MGRSSGEITGLLVRLRAGDKDAESRLAPMIYGRLHNMADRYMRSERPDHTLQATALLNEAIPITLEARAAVYEQQLITAGVADSPTKRLHFLRWQTLACRWSAPRDRPQCRSWANPVRRRICRRRPATTPQRHCRQPERDPG